MAFERWQQQLFDLLRAVQTKRHQYDQASRACQILLQPWPRKSGDRDAERKDAENKNENAQESPADPQEQAELKFVNDILSKAQKTRVKLSSKISKDDTKTTNEGPPTANSKQQLWEICKPEDAQKPEIDPDAEHKDHNFKAVPVIETVELSQQNNVVACSGTGAHTQHRKQLAKPAAGRESARPGSAKASGPAKKVHPALSSVTKPTFVADTNRSKSVESARSMRSQTRPGSGRGKVKPAHITAPFQTDPNLRVPKRQGRGPVNVVSVKQRNPAKNHIHSGGGRNQKSLHGGDARNQMKVLPPIYSESAQCASSSPDVNEEGVCDTPGSSASEQTETVPSNDERLQTRDDSPSFQSSSREPPSSKMSKLNFVNDSVNGVVQKGSDDTGSKHFEDSRKDENSQQDAKQFSLLSQGTSLNIPPKVRRAFAKNQQLRNKVLQKEDQRKTKSKGHNMGQEFADKLQELFDTEEELLYRQQALECLHTHQRLADILHHLNLDTVTELSSPSDVLRAKAMTEFVLSSFSTFSEDANLLSKVQFPATPPVPKLSHSLTRNNHQWIPPYGENQGPPEKVHYATMKELRKYMELMLQVQTLQCQQHLLQVLVSDVLPWLQKMDINHEDFGAVYRGVFSLLVADGNHLPALIQESLE